MKGTHKLSLLLALVHLADAHLEPIIYGPDFVTVGVPFTFECVAQFCSSCNYVMGINGTTIQGNSLPDMVGHWMESLNITCTAEKTPEGSFTVVKVLQVLDGPNDVSIISPNLLTIWDPATFQCRANCRPSCKFSWTQGKWHVGEGSEITITLPPFSFELTCHAENSVSGLNATASIAMDDSNPNPTSTFTTIDWGNDYSTAIKATQTMALFLFALTLTLSNVMSP